MFYDLAPMSVLLQSNNYQLEHLCVFPLKQMSELKIVCQHLDSLIVEYFDTQDELFMKQERLASDMKDGLFLMAKVSGQKHHTAPHLDQCHRWEGWGSGG